MYNACFNPLKYNGLVLSTCKSQHTTISCDYESHTSALLGEGVQIKLEQGGADTRMNHAD